ncbi:septation protein SepH [Arthrobacter sp. PsM3]|uniref:septation protein SepH n=1 Tax=Arthrobacter sp. PsM3 TaxID=3030531 RepID=UPI00263A7526|nr:septation protein SepH [Arthrobacter sp. PsM3]MDN4644494.1 septation protein SepH [Arthrobacter sp. PsM3]
MQDLRLVGVHDDGEHLLLSGAGGEMFQLPIDEALRAAASRTPAKAVSGAGAAPIAMSPRDIQARIRSGSTAAEVAELSGIPLAKVQRYEGPVLAEREYVAQQARRVEVASPAPGHDVYRSAFGDQPASLGEMVAHRLSAHGIEASTVEWDSWRRPDGSWNVVARFEAAPGGPAGIGEEPPAMWTFSPSRKSLQNANRWAQQLSELEPLDGPVPARRLTAVSDRPFDFETDADAAARTATAQLQVVQQLQLKQEQESDGLLDMLRSRRGQRLGVDEDADDALAVLLTNGVPAAHPRPSDVPAEPDAAEPGSGPSEPVPAEAPAAGTEPRPATDPWERRRDGRPSIMSRLTLAPRHQDQPDDALKLHDGVSTDTREITIVASQVRPAGQQGPTSSPGLDELLGGGTSRRQQRESAATAPEERDAEQPERQPAKPKRSSIPSWDDIVFGARGD